MKLFPTARVPPVEDGHLQWPFEALCSISQNLHLGDGQRPNAQVEGTGGMHDQTDADGVRGHG